MNVEEFALGNSIIHTLDSRTKILVTVAYSLVVSGATDWRALVVGILFPAALLFTARVDFLHLLRRLAAINTVTLFLWAILPFTVMGGNSYTVCFIEAHESGIHLALLITLKTNCILLTVIALLGTSKLFDLVHALDRIGVPDKIIHLLFFCFRYVHVIADEYQRMITAARMRGFKPSTNLHTYRTYAHFIAMLLVRSFDRSQRILAAMKCRGFKNKFYILHSHRLHSNDYALSVFSTFFITAMLVIK